MSGYRESGAQADILVVAFGDMVFGMNPMTGARIWVHRDLEIVPSAIRLVVDGETVIAGAGRTLTSLAYRTGRVVWRVDTRFPVDTMLVGPETITIGFAGQAAAYDRQSGRFLWVDTFQGCGQGAVSLGFPGNVVNADLDR